MMRKNKVIHEIKNAQTKIEQAHQWQVKYYIWLFTAKWG